MQDGAQGDRFSTPQTVYLWLAAVSSTCLVMADIVGVKLFHVRLWGLTVEHTTGMLTFPVTFVLTDVLNEFYGKKAARRVVYLSLAMAVLAFIVLNVAQAMPRLDAPYNIDEAAFDQVFGSARIMYVASLAAYLVGSLADIVLFAWIKRATGGKLVWLRATGSTVVSQFIDSFIVSYIAFSLGRKLFPAEGVVAAPFGDILKIAATGYTLKFVLAVLTTPVIYLIKWALTRYCGLRPHAPEA